MAQHPHRRWPAHFETAAVSLLMLSFDPTSTWHRPVDGRSNALPDMIRMSVVGLENVDNFLWDIDEALAIANASRSGLGERRRLT
jgi:hypothetical protein